MKFEDWWNEENKIEFEDRNIIEENKADMGSLSFLDDLVKLAFRDFKSNFMQIRKGCYNLI